MKEFYELANDLIFCKDQQKITKDWNDNGYRIINFSMVKSEYLKIINNYPLACRFNDYNDIIGGDSEMKLIYDTFQHIVFKESRGSRQYSAVGWENINSYLRYHSGIIYEWFKNSR